MCVVTTSNQHSMREPCLRIRADGEKSAGVAKQFFIINQIRAIWHDTV